ncbi:MAG: putative DNA-binding domain-containing protein [Pseudomonadales bacterium]
MPRSGDNLPGFVARQLDFAAHIRNPEVHARPVDVDPRRMQIYLDLFYNNIESFLAGGFPVAKRVLGHERWHALVRRFVHRHGSESPYFLEVSQEFLTFLEQLAASLQQPAAPLEKQPAPELPPFLLELCHYEWVELALAVAEEDLPDSGFDAGGDLEHDPILLSPLIWPLTYRFPVHQIGEGFQPVEPPPEPTHLVVYRRRDDQVKFLEANAFTLRLLELVGEGGSGGAVLARMAAEAPHVDPGVLHDQGLITLQRLRKLGIVLGTVTVEE